MLSGNLHFLANSKFLPVLWTCLRMLVLATTSSLISIKTWITLLTNMPLLKLRRKVTLSHWTTKKILNKTPNYQSWNIKLSNFHNQSNWTLCPDLQSKLTEHHNTTRYIFSGIVPNCLNILFPWSYMGGSYHLKKLQDPPAYMTSIRYCHC